MKGFVKIVFVIVLLGVAPSVFAQMTDEQIVDYVQTQLSKGVDDKQIAKDLMTRGVTLEHLQSLRDKYNNISQIPSSVEATSNMQDRGRMNNGEQSVQMDVPYPIPSKTIFGHNIFRSENLSFAPDMSIPTPSDYKLGAGDEVIIDIYGSSQASSSCKISPDGSISIPNEGLIYISGLTAAQAQDKVRSSVGGHFLDSEIRLTVGQTRTIIVHVMGEVQIPGTYTVSAFANVFNALYLSGGINEIGTMRDIQLTRGGKVISHLDIYDFILNGRLSGDLPLKDGDVIRVGTYENLVKIEGRVKRPMYYEMKKGETLGDLIRYSGEFTGDAYKEKIRVERKDKDGLTVFNVLEGDITSFHNLDGDVVVVDSALDRYKNTVSVEGAIFRPGFYRMSDDIHSVKTLVEHAGGLDEKAVTDLAVLLRMLPDRTTETLPVALGKILSGRAADMELKNEDKLIIASYQLRDSLRTLSIVGEVFNPGVYSYSSDETVATLVIRAGGMKETADPAQIEIARRITDPADNPDGKTMAQIFRVGLTDDFRLKPQDVITVVQSEYYQEQRMVFVEGEVRNAGAYAVSSSEERLSDFISRAGGLTARAFVGGVQITRTISNKEREVMRMELETATTAEDSLRIVNDMAKSTYYIGTDLELALKNPHGPNDIIIKEGDIISIPQMNNTVKISGAVLSPNTVNFEEGKGLSYYLNQAGGVSKQGHRPQSYIIYANGLKGKALSSKVQPGCEIIVPTKEKREINPQAAAIGLSTASVLASIAAVVASIIKK